MPTSSKRRITLDAVKGLKPGGLTWDPELPGFFVRCQREAKVYGLKYRISGRQRWYSISRHGAPWTPELARKEARRLLGLVVSGTDPASAKAAERTAPTVKTLADRFMREHVEAKRKPWTVDSYLRLLNQVILPELGNIKVQKLTRADQPSEAVAPDSKSRQPGWPHCSARSRRGCALSYTLARSRFVSCNRPVRCGLSRRNVGAANPEIRRLIKDFLAPPVVSSPGRVVFLEYELAEVLSLTPVTIAINRPAYIAYGLRQLAALAAKGVDVANMNRDVLAQRLFDNWPDDLGKPSDDKAK